MGACDLIPGISGGTVAFLLGIYEDLIDSLSSFGTNFLEKEKKKGYPIFFLLAGMGTSIFLFSHVIHHLLSLYRESLFATFCGLILASTFFLIKEIKKVRVLPLILGFLIAFTLPEPCLKHANITPLNLIIAGYFSISAMLLPGISGSYVLHLFNAYEPAIEALVQMGKTPLNSVGFLSFLLMGILAGAMTFTKVIKYLLKRHENITLSLLSGFMVGSLQMIVPKSPSMSGCLSCILGALIVFGLKRLTLATKKLSV